MTGEAEAQRKVLPDEKVTPLVNGDFEAFDEAKHFPDAWYYVREAEVLPHPEGDSGHFLRFHNDTPGRDALALQAIGLDGRQIKTLRVSFRYRTENVVSGPSQDQFATLYVNFFGEDRGPIRQELLGPWTGTSDWKEKSVDLVVPLSGRGAIVGIGLFGATGTLDFDDVRVEGVERAE
jgi:protein-L-isoaspartate(D-aspartate) O-methyltransferase